MQRQMQAAAERPHPLTGLGRFVAPRVDYRCPGCDSAQDEIRFDSVIFYADEDFMRLRPVGEAQLITMVNCGHQYRREFTP